MFLFLLFLLFFFLLLFLFLLIIILEEIGFELFELFGHLLEERHDGRVSGRVSRSEVEVMPGAKMR